MLRVGVSSWPRPLGVGVREGICWYFIPTLSIAKIPLSRRQKSWVLSRSWDWVCLTSQWAARFLYEELGELFEKGSIRWAAIGPKTAFWLEQKGIQPSFVPSSSGSEVFLKEFEPLLGEGVFSLLFPQAERARDLIPQWCERRGMLVERLVLYRSSPLALSYEQRERFLLCDWIVVTSPLAAQSLLPILRKKKGGVVAIGSFTKEALRHYGIEARLLPGGRLERIREVIKE